MTEWLLRRATDEVDTVGNFLESVPEILPKYCFLIAKACALTSAIEIALTIWVRS